MRQVRRSMEREKQTKPARAILPHMSTPSAKPPMKTWFVRLIPPRPTFAQDITPAESNIMEAHSNYLRGLFRRGVCLFAGPVFDPSGVYGIAVLAAEDEAAAHAIASADPCVKSCLQRMEIAEMRLAFPPLAE